LAGQFGARPADKGSTVRLAGVEGLPSEALAEEGN
jgi:hypothetical protein